MATLFSIHFESYSFSRFRKSMKSGNHHSSLQLLICTVLKAQNKPERSKKQRWKFEDIGLMLLKVSGMFYIVLISLYNKVTTMSASLIVTCFYLVIFFP